MVGQGEPQWCSCGCASGYGGHDCAADDQGAEPLERQAFTVHRPADAPRHDCTRWSDRKWLVLRSDLDRLLQEEPSLGRPKTRTVVEPTKRSDWSDAPEQATFDLASSVELPGGER